MTPTYKWPITKGKKLDEGRDWGEEEDESGMGSIKKTDVIALRGIDYWNLTWTSTKGNSPSELINVFILLQELYSSLAIATISHQMTIKIWEKQRQQWTFAQDPLMFS